MLLLAVSSIIEGGQYTFINRANRHADLDSTLIRRSHKHPTLCTVIVDGFQTHNTAEGPTASRSDGHHWRLPSTDPRDEGNFLFRLHTIDLYFWTLADAETFIDHSRKTLQQEQLEILDAPRVPTPAAVPSPAPHSGLMSPVVQQLENVAITDPAYHNGQTPNSRNVAMSTVSPSPVAKQTSETYAPLAYNPAAPAAPEPIKHREKTPPPPEDIPGTGLAAAAYHDQAHSYAPQSPNPIPPPPPNYPQSHQSYAGGQSTSKPSLGYNSPTPSTGYAPSNSSYSQQYRASSISSPPPSLSQNTINNPYSPEQKPSIGSPTQGGAGAMNLLQPHIGSSGNSYNPDPNAHLYGQSTTPLESPATQILGSSYVGHQPLQHYQPQYVDYLSSRPQPSQPVGGYSNYNYEQPQHHHGHHSQGQDHGIHSQVYRPTEEEANSHGRRPSGAGPGQQPGKLEQRAERVEKGVNRFLKKLEKRIG